MMSRLGAEVQLEQLSARWEQPDNKNTRNSKLCFTSNRVVARWEQPDNKNTRNSKLHFTSNRVVALFTGGRTPGVQQQGTIMVMTTDSFPGSWVPDGQSLSLIDRLS